MLLFSGTFFGVFWSEGTGYYPQASSNCNGIATCQVHDNTTCLCETSVQTASVFDGSLEPTVSELLSRLHIGAPNPSHVSATYTRCPVPLCNQSQYEIWSNTNITNYASAFSAGTIFKVTDPTTGEVLYLSNTKSIVNVGGGHAFRNPPMFNSPVDATQAQGLTETDEILRNYYRHPNTGKFSYIRVILFSSSNANPLILLTPSLCWSNLHRSSLYCKSSYPKSHHFQP